MRGGVTGLGGTGPTFGMMGPPPVVFLAIARVYNFKYYRATFCSMSTPAMLTPYDARRGAAIVAAALAEWKSGVREPPKGDPGPIREYLRTIRHSAAESYDSDGDAEWCGAFAGFCLVSAGVRPELLRQQSPAEAGGIGSTYRLHSLCRLDERRRITGVADVRMGDVLVVGRLSTVTKARPRWGEHIVIAAGPATPHDEDSTIPTVEGNASGAGPSGEVHEGVIRRSRPCTPTTGAKGFLFGYRPLPGDCISEVFHG